MSVELLDKTRTDADTQDFSFLADHENVRQQNFA